MLSIEILPKDWRVLLQKEYREQLATCGRRTVASPEPTIDPEAFLTNLYAALGTAPDGDSLEQLWDEWDVEATLTGDEWTAFLLIIVNEANKAAGDRIVSAWTIPVGAEG